MEPWQALILGILQGLTEFLPVSSSTHLSLLRNVLGIEGGANSLYFDLLCHAGTLSAAGFILRKELLHVFTCKRSFALLTLALLPLIPAYFLLKPIRLALQGQGGSLLIVTGALLLLASSNRKDSSVSDRSTWRHALTIGAMQSLAILPGISRSGATMATARLLGWSWQEAARFSFLLAIPTIFGGSLLETLHLPSSHMPWDLCFIGFFASFAVGLGSLRLLFWILERNTPRPLAPFAWYCLMLGTFLLIRS